MQKHTFALDQFPPIVHEWQWRLGFTSPERHAAPLDVFHSWDWIQPPLKNTPLISTIHDLAMLKFPDIAHPKVLAMHQRSWEILGKKAAHLIVVSEATKRDCVQLLGFHPKHISVVHEAVPQEFIELAQHMTEEQRQRARIKIPPRPYIFFVGTREPRKNLMRLIQAWEPLASEIDLCIAGETGWGEQVNAPIGLGAQSHLHFLGRVREDELAELYRHARMFAYPSLDEGFGLPILEAYILGVPVLTSGVGGMLEVGGNAAQYVEPQEVESIRQGLQALLREDAAQLQLRRQQMRVRTQLFDWRRVAEQTLRAYTVAATRGEGGLQ